MVVIMETSMWHVSAIPWKAYDLQGKKIQEASRGTDSTLK
jgi:hypothetical protein